MTDDDRNRLNTIMRWAANERGPQSGGNYVSTEDIIWMGYLIDRLEADSKLDRDILGDWLGHSESVKAMLINDVIERTRRETAEKCWNIALQVKKDFEVSAAELEARGYGVAGIARSAGTGAMRVAENIASELGLEQS